MKASKKSSLTLNKNTYMAEDCRFGSCRCCQLPAKTQKAAQLPNITIGSMKASCPYHKVAKGLNTESLTQWAYALNCVDCKTNHGYVETYNDGKNLLSHFDKNYADMVDYYKWGGDFPGDVNTDDNE